MARLTVAQIMASIGASVNQDATAPTTGGSEWTLWLEFINRAVQEWAEANEWEELRKDFRPTISGVNNATVALPQDFKELAAAPIYYGSGVNGGEQWPAIIPEQKFLYNNEAKWVQVRGDISNGYNLLWNPGTLASGATLIIPYFSIPTSLASPAQIPVVYDSQFLIDRTIAYVWEVRSDPRFQQQETKARERLLEMVENHNIKKYSSYAGANPVITTNRRISFRLGRD